MIITFFTVLVTITLVFQYLTQNERFISERMNRYIDSSAVIKPAANFLGQRKLSGWRSVVSTLPVGEATYRPAKLRWYRLKFQSTLPVGEATARSTAVFVF